MKKKVRRPKTIKLAHFINGEYLGTTTEVLKQERKCSRTQKNI